MKLKRLLEIELTSQISNLVSEYIKLYKEQHEISYRMDNERGLYSQYKSLSSKLSNVRKKVNKFGYDVYYSQGDNFILKHGDDVIKRFPGLY